MAGFRVEDCEETKEMYLLTYRVKGMYTGLLKTRLPFWNRNNDSDLNFTEFFEAILRLVLPGVLLAIISRKQYLQ